MKRFFGQLWDATIMNFRQGLRDLGILVAFGVIFPLGFLFFLGQIVQHALLAQVVAGSMMMEMGLININVVAQNMGQDKQSKILDLWVSLPIQPTVYVLSLALFWLPFSMLSGGVTLAAGIVYFHLAFPPTAVAEVLLALVLVWASSLGIGFLIGVYGKSPRQINQLANFVGVVMTFLTPIFYPITVLPIPVRYVAYAWPLTWGATLLTAIIHGTTSSVVIASAVLGGFTALWAVLIAFGLRWRAP
ncbi:MAG: ABC transporter permease [Thermoplasmata archaeon]